MPNRDKTGPEGMGAMTGRRMGFCAGFDSPGYANTNFGRGRGQGRGMGWRARASSPNQFPANKEQEKQSLTSELESLKDQMKEIEKRLDNLD